MDFKVAGTDRGVTALQMDIKITSITEEIMRIALDQAREGRIHILGEMAKALTGARDEVSENAPRITTLTIPREKIREVIGSGGKVIREITETTGAKIDIDDDGTVKVAAVDGEAARAAIDWIRGIVAEPEVGVIYPGKVVKVVDFGAFVNFLGSRDGLVHISELAPHRVGKVADVVKLGDAVKVKVLGFDDRGIAGFCWTKVHPPAPPYEPDALGEIYVIGVDPERQGSGLGRALVVGGLKFLADRGMRTGMLFVDAVNTGAVALYEKLGFTTVRVDRAFGRAL